MIAVVLRLLALVGLVACGAAPTARDQLAASFRATVRLDLAMDGVRDAPACGTSGGTYAEFLAAPSAARDCFTRAFQACQPAHVTGSYHGTDSGPFLWSATVVPSRERACEIHLYSDSRNDVYGAAAIVRRRCPALGGECPVVWTEEHVLCRRVPDDHREADVCSRLPPSTRWTP